MGIVDIVICMCLIPAILIGIFKGFVKQVIAFLIAYLGITLSLRFADALSTWLLKYVTMNPFWLKVVAFVLIWTAVALLLQLLGKLLDKVIKISILGWLNRLLGALISIAIAIILLSLFAYLLDAINGLFGFLPKKEFADSQLYPLLLDASKSIFPHLRQLF